MRKERGFYSNVAWSWRMEDSCLKAHPSEKPKRKLNCLLPDQSQKQQPEFPLPFKVSSFVNCRKMLSGHPGDWVFLLAIVQLQAPPYSPCVWSWHCHWSWSFQGQKILWTQHTVCSLGGSESISSFPWVYISFLWGTDQVLSQPKHLVAPGGSIPQMIPFFPQSRQQVSVVPYLPLLPFCGGAPPTAPPHPPTPAGGHRCE